MQIEGSRILVTGASSGIGAALAELLVARGATVGLVARREDRLQAVLAACRDHAPDSRYWAVDLGDLERAEQVRPGGVGHLRSGRLPGEQRRHPQAHAGAAPHPG